MSKLRFYFSAGRGADPEKAVFPALIFVSTSPHTNAPYYQLGVRGFGLALGWWHWSVKMNVFWMVDPSRKVLV